jgi:hypothetical protein
MALGAKFKPARPRKPRQAWVTGKAFDLDLSPVPVGYVRFVSVARGVTVDAALGDGLVVSSGGGGGWEEIARPRKRPIVSWTAGVAYRLAVPILLDRFVENRTVQPDIDLLEAMARGFKGATGPSPVRVVLPGGQPHSAKVDWVIEDIAWEGEERGSRSGRRTRATGTVTLLEFTADELVSKAPAGKFRRDSNPGDRPRTYVWKKGDTLAKVAQRLLGDKDRAREIAKLNKVRDPSRIDVGDKLKIPRGKKDSGKKRDSGGK